MNRKKVIFLLAITTLAFFVSVGTGKLVKQTQEKRLSQTVLSSAGYREQNIGERFLSYLQKQATPGKQVGIYLLETKFGYQDQNHNWSEKEFEKLEKNWKKDDAWDTYIEITKSIWNEVKYFPIPQFPSEPFMTVSYTNSWMNERTYGGKRGHEGTDLMARKNIRGLYPIVSMTDGVVEKKGWVEKGGYRIGIKTNSGAYFYYAHLDSYANVEVGDEVKAGDILGYMGDSGYGPEGTIGKFAVHLHLGIYIYPNNIETSINPYWILRYIENRKVKCYTKE